MPSYNVERPGFFHGRLYGPNSKRPVLTVDKPFTEKTKPSWVGSEVAEVVEDKAETPEAGTETLTGDEVKVSEVTTTTGEQNSADFSGSSDVTNSENAQVAKPVSGNVETL